MKRILLCLWVLGCLSLVGCEKPNPYTPPEEPVVKLPTIKQETTANGYRQDPTDVVYYANTKTKKFHRPDCTYVQSTAETSLRLEKDKEVLAADGYTPCQHCKP